MPLVVKINMRKSSTGSSVRTVRLLNNYTLNLRHNSLASSFSFNFLFDPANREHAEMFCVSHLHECIIYYTANEDPRYQVYETDRVLTGYLMVTNLKDQSTPYPITVSGYSRPGNLNDCSNPPETTLEIEGVSLQAVIERMVKPFGIEVVYDKTGLDIYRAFAKNVAINEKNEPTDNVEVTEAGYGDDDDIGKNAPESTENVGSFLTNLAKQRNVVLSSDPYGRLVVTGSNTKGKPKFTLDFTDGAAIPSYKKIPGVECELNFNGQQLHTHITVKAQADEDEKKNSGEVTIRNPFIPIGKSLLYRPITHTLESGSEFTVKRAAKYELSKEIREAIQLTIKMGVIDVNGFLITPNNTLMIRNPKLFLYNLCRWFIQSVDISVDEKQQTATLSCVPPFAYDFDGEEVKDIFVDPHDDFPTTVK